MTLDTSDIALAIARETGRRIEREMVRIVEVIEGRVPSNEEVEMYGESIILQVPGYLGWPQAEQIWFWKGRPIIIRDRMSFYPKVVINIYALKEPATL